MKKILFAFFPLLAASYTYAQNSFPSTGVATWGNASGTLGTDPSGQIELGPSSASAAAPYIDFHAGIGSSQDYNVRIINDGNSRLNFKTLVNGTVFTINGAIQVLERLHL